jgi:aromatic-L-amino-acid decarboxylase
LPKGSSDLDEINQALVDRINNDGRIYLTQTNIDGAKVIRFQVGQFDTTQEDVQTAYHVICDIARQFDP